MKKVVLLFALAMTASVALFSQTVLWSEPFNGGSNGWTVRTVQCGNITGAHVGRWTLTSATVNGTAVPNLQAEFQVNTIEDYSVRFTDGTNRGEMQARYTLAADALTSNLNGVTIPLNSTIFNYNATNRQTLYFTNMNIVQSEYTAWGSTLIGVGSPSFTVNGSTLTIANAGNTVQFVFSKAADCGAMWWWSPNGSVRSGALFNAATGEVVINSPTAANGAMVLNSDYLTTRGLSANVPSGPPPYPQYTSELISPKIDLSAITANVSLSFYQLVRFLNPATSAPAATLRTSYAVSTDDGATWGDAINVNPDLAVNTAQQSQRLFPLPGVQGSANVRIKFIFSSDFYYWALDDIALLEQPRYDMRVNTNFFAITPNFATPASQVEPWRFLADIENVGAATSTGVNLNLTISNATTMAVAYDGDVVYGDVAAGFVDENRIFPTASDPANFPTGNYNGRYEVTADSTDAFPVNNVINWNFVVTDTLFTKEGARTRGIAPAAEPSFTYGNIYYVPNGAGLYARYLSFGVTNATELTGRSVTTLLYKWQDTNDNAIAEPAEYGGAPIAFNSYEFTGTEGTNFITLPFDLDGNAIELEDGYHYIAAVQYFTEDDQSMFISGNGVLNYGAAVFVTDSLNQNRFHTALVVGQNSSPSFSTAAFGQNICPQIRMSIGDNPDLTGSAFVTSTNEIVKENLLEVFPNPASEVVNLKLMLEEPQDVQITIFDMHGHLLNTRKFDNVSRETIELSVRDLPAGTYMVRLATPNGTNVRQIVVGR